MAATDGQILVAAARWSDEGHYLRELVSKHKLPAIVKIIKGQYGGLGVPSLPCPGLQSTALVVSAGRRRKIVAQAVKLKEGRRVIGVGPRLAIPDTYEGYFEILSEEGRAVRCMETVVELARRRPEAGCLVREPVRAIVARYEDNGSITADGARTIAAGETLLISGEASLGGSKGRYLKCLDSRGDTVLLGLEQRGRFSAIAKEDNISGVHTARNLLCKRLPLTVRLVHGTPPRGPKAANHFVPELRLLSTFEEEHIFALPLQKETNSVIALPLAAPLKLQRAKNDDQLRGLREFQRLVEKCGKSVSDVADRIQVLDGKLGDSKALRLSGASQMPSKTGYLIRRSASSESANGHIQSHGYGHRDENRQPPASGRNQDEYDEIDQIYDYVRGFAPLPKSVRTPFAENQTPGKEAAAAAAAAAANVSPPISPISTPAHLALLSTDEKKPEPPPIETIPGKKIASPVKAAEKRTRRASSAATKDSSAQRDKTKPPLSKLYVKNNTQRGTHVLRQKSGSPMKELPLNSGKDGSPLFNIRYKSLTNLQQAMEVSGTLDSSQSGGRTSGDSGAGAKLPEKRSRKISRPRSLTNLVWELRGAPPTVPMPEPIVIERKSMKPNRLEPGVHRKNSNKLTIGGSKRPGTLFL